MAVRITIELPASIEDYDKVRAADDDELPEGMIVHSAADQGGSVKVVDIWESAEAFAKFAEERLGPAVAKALGEGGPQPGEPQIEKLHNLELVDS